MRLAVIIVLLAELITCTYAETYIDELLNDNESTENTVVASNEIVKRNADEGNEQQDEKNVPQAYHPPKPSNMIENDDIMVQASPAEISIKQSFDDLMAMRTKRQTRRETKHKTVKDNTPTFKRIYDFITNHDMMSPISNERNEELTAQATKAGNRVDKRDDSQNEMSNIFNGIQSTKHHKLTRTDIRKLAKKAVMLATLKKLNEAKTKTDAKKSSITSDTKKDSSDQVKSSSKDKKGDKKSKVSKKTKKAKKSKKKSVPSAKPTLSISGKDVNQEKTMDNIGDTLNVKETKPDKTSDKIEGILKDTTKDSTFPKMSEMSEDISGEKQKKSDIESLFGDDTMEKEKSSVSTLHNEEKKMPDEGLDELFQTDKKNTIEKPMEEKKTEDSLLEETTTDSTAGAEALLSDSNIFAPTKKSELPNTKLNEQIKSLRYALGKSSPNKVPEKFFPDLPVGIRMIAWKKLLVKKTKELEQLEAAVGGSDSGTADTSDNKPVMINIDIDQDKTEKDALAALAKKDIDKKTAVSDDDKTSSHVHYLQKHIKGARALRKLIAKTLIGHCKTTGKRILRAFIAMDKALARAQAIANVIGHKFKIDPDRIDLLVGDKEDQVVETFLRDIFTKI